MTIDSSAGLGVSGPIVMPRRRADALWDDLSRALLLCLVVLAVLTFQSYGISTDEEVQHIYGKKLLAYYLSGFTDRSAFHFKDLYLYGGLFDLVTAVLVHISPFPEYDTRHLLCALVGILGIAGCWRYARLLAGPRAGFLAAALIALSGVYYGAMFNNTKDVPFAAGMVWCLYFASRILAQLPTPRRGAVLKFGVVLGLTLAIRVGAVLAGFYLAVGLLAYVALTARLDGVRMAVVDSRRIAVALLPALPVAYILMAFFWPWAVQRPLNPLRALNVVSHFPLDIGTLFMGTMVHSSHPPALYLPVYLGVKLPEALLIGAVLAIGMAGLWAARRGWRGRGAILALRWAPLGMGALLPILLFMLLRPTVYNGIRHFLFVVPPLAVMAGIAIDRLWFAAETYGHRVGQAFAAVAATVGMLYVWQLASIHPNQYVYYNLFTGGMKGAQGRFELDYWGNSQYEALEELIALVERENDGHAPPRQYKLAVCGNTAAVRFDLPPWLKLVNSTPADWRSSDFYMAFTQAPICPSLLDGDPVIEIAADDVPLTIVKDRRPPTAAIPTE